MNRVKTIVLVAVAVVGFTGGVLAAELRNGDTVRVVWPAGGDDSPLLGCVREESGGFACFDFKSFQQALEEIELDSYPPKGDL